MRIRKATIEDTKKIVEIFREEYAKEPYDENWNKEAATKRIKNYFKDHELFVLEINGVVEGLMILTSYVWHNGMRGFLHELVVSHEQQGKGYGRKLIEFAEDFFRKRGMKEVNLMSSKKPIAYKIYKKMGYTEENGFVSMFKEIN